MDKFPLIQAPIYPLKETIPDTAIKGELENQTIVARKRFTRTPRRFGLSWSALKQEDYEKLRAFFLDKNGGEPFIWTYPAEGVDNGKIFVVRFSGDFDFTLANPSLWQGSITLVEV